MEVLAAPTFDHINRNAQPYPAYLLPEGGTALALFSAGFYGWNDVIHMSRKQMSIDCVDTDADKLWEMAGVYPPPFNAHAEDAWEFAARAAAEGREWDVVSVDPFMGDAAERAWDTLWLFASLAVNLVTLTVDPDRPIWAPIGWMADLFPRSRKAAWMVLRRA